MGREVVRMGDSRATRMKPDYYLSHDLIQRWATQQPATDEEMDRQQLAREFLHNEKRLERALRKLARRLK